LENAPNWNVGLSKKLGNRRTLENAQGLALNLDLHLEDAWLIQARQFGEKGKGIGEDGYGHSLDGPPLAQPRLCPSCPALSLFDNATIRRGNKMRRRGGEVERGEAKKKRRAPSGSKLSAETTGQSLRQLVQVQRTECL